jgi:hypothetical protein
VPVKVGKNVPVRRDDKAAVSIGHDEEPAGFAVLAQFRRDAFCIMPFLFRHGDLPLYRVGRRYRSTSCKRKPRWLSEA